MEAGRQPFPMQVSGGGLGLHEKKPEKKPSKVQAAPSSLCDLRVTFILGPACIESEIKIYSGYS